MGVAALALGILGFLVFSWLGPVVVGGAWAAAASVSQPGLVTWPLWAAGIGIGVVPGLIAVVLGIVALKKEPKKGVALAGLVIGAIGALGGLIATFVMVVTLSIADRVIDNPAKALDQEMKKPVVQQGLKELMDQTDKQSGQ